MTVHAFKAAAGRDLILGQLMHAMQNNNYNSVWARTLDLLERHAKDPATVQPFLVAMEYLNQNNQPLTALRTSVGATPFANPGSPLMNMVANLVVNSADHVPAEDIRSVLDELFMAAVQSFKDPDAFLKISEKLCSIALTCGDQHRDFAMEKVLSVIEGLILPKDFEGDIPELYFDHDDVPCINTILPPNYLDTLARLADQFSTYDQQNTFNLYEIIVTGFSEDAFEGYNIPEKLNALMNATDNPVKIHLAFSAACLLVDAGLTISPEIEDAAMDTMERTNAIINGEVLEKNIKPVALKDFLNTFPLPDGP